MTARDAPLQKSNGGTIKPLQRSTYSVIWGVVQQRQSAVLTRPPELGQLQSLLLQFLAASLHCLIGLLLSGEDGVGMAFRYGLTDVKDDTGGKQRTVVSLLLLELPCLLSRQATMGK